MITALSGGTTYLQTAAMSEKDRAITYHGYQILVYVLILGFICEILDTITSKLPRDPIVIYVSPLATSTD